MNNNNFKKNIKENLRKEGWPGIMWANSSYE